MISAPSSPPICRSGKRSSRTQASPWTTELSAPFSLPTEVQQPKTKMKKSLLALAALSVTGTAFAQSSLTIYGTVDAALAYYKGEGVGSRTQLVSGSNAQTRFGFRGREDLGGGTYAAFELESGFGTDSGVGQASNTNNQAVTGTAGPASTQGFTFNRKAFVSMVGPWGDVRLGRDYVPTFWQLFAYDP